METPICEGHGSWLEHIEFDGETYWTIEDPFDDWHLPNEKKLPISVEQEFFLESDSG